MIFYVVAYSKAPKTLCLALIAKNISEKREKKKIHKNYTSHDHLDHITLGTSIRTKVTNRLVKVFVVQLLAPFQMVHVDLIALN